MDRRDNAAQESAFLKDLKAADAEYDDKVEYNGKIYRVPYRMIKEIVFSDLDKRDLRDIEHAARLQYRLLLMDSVLKAKVEFAWNRISITYNPLEAKNRKEKTSSQQLIDFLLKEGINVDPAHAKERDLDYFEEIYKYQFEPSTIREHAPYGYTRNEWKAMKPQWEQKQKELIESKYGKFKGFQEAYLDTHPELAKEHGHVAKQNRRSFVDKLLGKGKKEGEKEKGFWFHGV